MRPIRLAESWLCAAGTLLAGSVWSAQPNAPAVVVVTDQVLARDIEPLGLNIGPLSGGTNNATNQLFPNPGFEPIVLREIQRVTAGGAGWFEFDNITYYELRGPGFGNGARVRFFRLVDEQGQPLPFDSQRKLDVTRAHHVLDLGEAKVRMPDSQHPLGGWVATKYGDAGSGGGEIRYNTSFTDPCYYAGEGETGWYVVKAVDTSGNESVVSREASATPSSQLASGPRLVGNGGRLPMVRAGADYWASLNAVGGTKPYRFSVTSGTLPEGIQLDPLGGQLTGVVQASPQDIAVTIEVRDATGQTDNRVFRFNAPADIADKNDRTAPEPPSDLKATPGNGYVTLTWTASKSADVAFYRVLRSDVPAAQQQERVYLDSRFAPRPGDHAFIYLRTNEMPATASHFRVRTANSGSARTHTLSSRESWTCRLVAHPDPIPADLPDRGETCLEITATGPERVSGNPAVFYPWQGYTGEDKWYSQLHPNTKYRVEVWLHQDGNLGDDGNVYFVLNGCYRDQNAREPWTTTTEWRKHVYEFTSPPQYPTEGGHSGPGLSFTGPGKLYVDNFLFYRVDDDHPAVQVPVKFALDEVLASAPPAGKKGCLRFYGVGFGDTSMQANLNWHSDSTYVADWYTAVNRSLLMTLPAQMEYALRTGSRPENRMVPMLTVIPDFFPEEWQAMVEYLGVPYDPAAGDTPQSKPFACARYLQRGKNGTPWTDEFREILIEIGNETWHNKALPMWDGFGWTGAVMQGGKEYGLFARHMIDETVMQMPAWKQFHLGRKIKWALGANYSTDLEWGYGELAMAQGPRAAYLGHANYVGPKWETGDAAEKTFTDDGVQKTLLAFLMNETAKATVDGAAKSRDLLQASGKADYALISYEGGPSGYDHRDLNNKTSELYGKSEAMAVAALDAWLHSSVVGYKHQCYLGYQSGTGWSSHTMPEAGGFRAHAGWLALKMRNRFAKGDRMIEANVTATPALTINDKVWPLVGAYAMKDEFGNYSVFVLSRKLDGRHSGTDLGDGYTPVTLKLPFAKARKITLHTLARPDGSPVDPRENNFDAEKIKIISREVPVGAFKSDFVIEATTGGGARGLPPGGIFLYVFEGCEPTAR